MTISFNGIFIFVHTIYNISYLADYTVYFKISYNILCLYDTNLVSNPVDAERILAMKH